MLRDLGDLGFFRLLILTKLRDNLCSPNSLQTFVPNRPLQQQVKVSALYNRLPRIIGRRDMIRSGVLYAPQTFSVPKLGRCRRLMCSSKSDVG